jgi:hypothetical protein
MHFTKLPLHTLQHFSPAIIEEYLCMQQSNSFEISIDIEFHFDDYSRYFSIEYAYVHAAYAGHLLCSCADSFSYTVPWPYHKCPFQFRVTATNLSALAAALYTIVQGYFDEDEEMVDYSVNAAAFYVEALECIEECKILGLFQVAMEYSNKLHEGDDEGDDEDEQ